MWMKYIRDLELLCKSFYDSLKCEKGKNLVHAPSADEFATRLAAEEYSIDSLAD